MDIARKNHYVAIHYGRALFYPDKVSVDIEGRFQSALFGGVQATGLLVDRPTVEN